MKNNKKKFDRNNKARDSEPVGKVSIEDVSMYKDKKVIVRGIIDRIVQTGGPTVFHVSDGTGNLPLKAFEGAGVRAHPDLKEGDGINAVIEVGEFRDGIEGEIQTVHKLSHEELVNFQKHLSELERKRAAVNPPQFLVKSPILDKLKDRFVQAATEIRLAIIQNRPIVVRHHNDADGYSAGYAIERAIVPLIEKQHGAEGKAAWEFYTRAPCAAPFYEIEDSIKDTAHSLSDAAKFSNKMPLVIIVDNGSSQEDLMAIQQGKIHGLDFIIVDHHYFEKDVISPEVLVHISPFLVGEDGAQYSAGMLCTEFARFINPEVQNITQIASMAGIADRINNPPVMKAYEKIAAEEGYTPSLLGDIATVIDFVSSKLRFMEAREYIEVLFGEPRDKQKRLVALMAPYLYAKEKSALEVAKSSAHREKIKSTTLQLLPIEETFSRGAYPRPGKIIGILHDYVQEKEGLKSVVSIGVLQDAMTIRATDAANFSVHELIEHLHKEVPAAFAEGGGHKNAGAIKFVPKKREEVLESTKKYIKSKSS